MLFSCRRNVILMSRWKKYHSNKLTVPNIRRSSVADKQQRQQSVVCVHTAELWTFCRQFIFFNFSFLSKLVGEQNFSCYVWRMGSCVLMGLFVLKNFSMLWQIQRAGFDSRRYHVFSEVVGLEQGPLCFVSTIEKQLGTKSSGSGLENQEYGRRDLSH
jgi:hypothetical protein